MSTALPQQPLLKRHLLPLTIGADENVVLTEDRAWLWKGRGFDVLRPYLDGQHGLGELFDLLGEQLTPPEVVYLLKQLQTLGLLADGSPPAASAATAELDGELAFWHAMGVDQAAAERSRSTAVRVRTVGAGAELEVVAAVLETAGVERAMDAEVDAALEIVVTDHYFRPQLRQINAAAIATRRPWMVCKLVGHTQWIGPIFGHADDSGCMTCLQHRLRLNRQVEDFVVRKTGDPGHYATSAASWPIATRLGASWLAQEVRLWLAGRTERLAATVLSMASGPQGPLLSSHRLVRRPQCPDCGDPDYFARRPTRVTLQPRPSATLGDGTSRAVAVESTLAALEPHVSPITGVVTWLRDELQDADGVVHSYSAGHGLALGPDTLRWLQRSLRAHARGKGATDVEARVSAIAEAIERSCGVFHTGVPRLRSTYAALGADAVHPNACLHFSPRQYARRDALNAEQGEGSVHLIPRPFDEDLEIDWVAAWSLGQQATRYLPAALCYYAHPDVERSFYCVADANGCAAGNVVEEAILAGFLELVERDSAAIWWYNRLRRPAIDLDATADPYVQRVRTWHRQHGRAVWALDLTSDLDIPVVAAVSQRVDGATADLLIGFSAHLSGEVAVRRALIEMNQFLPAVSGRTPAGATIHAWPDQTAVRFWQQESLATQPQLVPDPDAAARAPGRAPGGGAADLTASLHTCLDIARRHDLEVLVVDQSQPDLPLSVVRVVVPGLRHFWRRLGPGRLYDVPVRLGWLRQPMAEDDLNPTSIFF